MSRPSMVEAPVAPITLAADGGLFVAANCRQCGGPLEVEARSRGREDMASCAEVRASVFCRTCKKRYVLLVQLVVAP